MARTLRWVGFVLMVLMVGFRGARPSLAGPPDALEPWSTVFAAEMDSVVALTEDGILWRAPFHMAARETLWRPSPRERLARLSVSPRGLDVAWLSRQSDHDSTRLWVWYQGTLRLLASFESFRPARLEILHYEPTVPTVEDRGARGGRFIRPDRAMRGTCSNAFAWTADGGSVVFSTDEGVGIVNADGTGLRRVSGALVSKLIPLLPAPIFLARVLTGDHQPYFVEHRLLYPAVGAWRLFDAPGFGLNDLWTANESTVWWADGRKIRAVRSHDPTPTVEFDGDDAVRWIEYDPSRRCLEWATGRRLMRRAEGDPDQVVFDFADGIRSVLGGPGARRRAIFTEQDLLIWTPADDSTRRVSLDGGLGSAPLSLRGVSLRVGLGDRSPFALFEAPSGQIMIATGSPTLDLSPGLMVGGGLGQGFGILPAIFPSLHRVEALYQVDSDSARLEPVPMPAIDDGRCFATTTSSHVLLVRTRPWTPGPVRAFDIETRRWREFDTPTAAARALAKASAAPDSVVRVWEPRARIWLRVKSPGLAAWEPLAR